jgi:hypothetical protein
VVRDSKTSSPQWKIGEAKSTLLNGVVEDVVVNSLSMPWNEKYGSHA